MSNKLGVIGGPTSLQKFLVTAVLLIGLSGCAGGGNSNGDGDTTQSQNQPPSANAGESQEALESTVVTLNGSASSDSDGSISSYSWEQVSNGATTLTISNSTSSEASVELPGLANNVEFVFRLTVTDNDEESAQDEVVITGRPTPSIMVSDVSGNTATLNSAAEFSVQLASQPSLNVSIPLSSSDESEGVPEQSELTFTPENWQQAQTVVVRGTNENVQNGEQNYQIILDATASLDSFYNAIDPEDVTIEGIVLEISEPETLNQFIANIESSLQIQINYTGNNDLSFSLTESPQGMDIDLSTGKISWTPQESDEGQTYTVVVSANDGNKFTTLEFQVSVATPEPVETEVSGDTLSVIDSSTTLNGMTITTQANTLQQSAANLQTTSASTSDLTQLNIEKLDVIEVPEIPTWITPLTDVFVVRTGFEGDLKVRFPISNLPDNVSLSDISLYGYAESLGDEGKSWAPLLIDINFEGTLAAPIIVIDLSGLEGMAFLGYATPQDQTTDNLLEGSSITSPSMRSASSAEAASTDNISCEQQSHQSESYKFVCSTADDSDVKITILGFGDQETRWGGAKKEDLVSWLLDAQGKFSASSLGYDKEMLVNIHQLEDNSYGGVSSAQDFKVLHITSPS